LLHLTAPLGPDESDAAALALCHIQTEAFQRSQNGIHRLSGIPPAKRALEEAMKQSRRGKRRRITPSKVMSSY
jgi:hypothetical protein